VNRSKKDLQKIIQDNTLSSRQSNSRFSNSLNISLSRLTKSNIDANNNVLLSSLDTLSPKTPRTPKSPKTPQTPKTPITLKSKRTHGHPDINVNQNKNLNESEYDQSHKQFLVSKSLKPYHHLYKNSSFVQSDPYLASSSTTHSNPSSSLSSNALVDMFLVTKPRKVGLNILNQHIEYAVIARKFGVNYYYYIYLYLYL